MYKCGKCGKPIGESIHINELQCVHCGSKIFYRERPSVKKVLKAR